METFFPNLVSLIIWALPMILASVLAVMILFIVPVRFRVLAGVVMFLYGATITQRWDMSLHPNFFWAGAWIMIGVVIIIRWTERLVKSPSV